MAIQQWTVIKLVGPAANDAASRFARWWKARRLNDPMSQSDWRPSTRRAVASYLGCLEEHRCEIPVAYFSQHVDYWLADGQVQSHIVGARMRVMHDAGELWCYRLPDRGRLVKRNKSLARSAQFPEGTWLSNRLIEAAHAYDSLWREATLLVNRRAIASSPADAELIARATVLPKWIGGSGEGGAGGDSRSR